MTKTVDQKVVEMQFNNKDFEKNVKTSMSTIEKLKQVLNFGKETKSLDQLQRQADSVKFNGLANTLESVANKFTGLQIAATLAFYKIADAAANAALQIAKSLTIGPIFDGYADYGRKLTSVQTITNATGKTIDEVNAYFKELDTYADKTIYNLDDMTSAFAKFTNAGVDLNKSVPAIKGIANMVAVAGQDAGAAQIAFYNLSQSIAGGFLTTIDYKSLNLANVATVEWKQNMANAAVAAGKLKKTKDGLYIGSGIKEAVTLQALFNSELDKQWATTDILLKVLGEYGDETTAIGKKSQAAAQDVKSFRMMMDTLKAAAGTGWTDTFEILIGNLEESKKLFTPMTNAVGGFLDRMSESRNTLLKEWKDLGGRDNLLAGLTNTIKAFGAILKPIGQAFREIFPPMTGKRLAELTENFKEFTSRLIIGEKTANKIKSTFKGAFAIVKTIINIIVLLGKAVFNLISIFLPLGEGILTVTAAFGEWLEKTTKVVRDSNVISKALNKIVDTVKMVTIKIKEFIKETLKLDNMMSFFKGMFTFIQKIGIAIGNIFASIIRNGDLKSVMDVFNTGLFGGLIITVTKLFKNLTNATKSLSNTFKGIEGLLKGVKDILAAYTQEINSKTLLNIAKAVALLAASLFILSLIPSDKIMSSLGALAGIMTEFMLMFKVFTLISKDVTRAARSSLAMIAMSTSILILASALKKLGSLNLSQIGSGLLGMAGAMTILMIALYAMPDNKRVMLKSIGLINMALAMMLMATALKMMGNIPMLDICKGLLAMAGTMTILMIALNKMPSGTLFKGTAMIPLSMSLLILGAALEKLGSLSWSEIVKSLATMGGAFLILNIALNTLPTKGTFTKSIAMIPLTTSLLIMGASLKKLASLSWEDIKKSLTVMAGALAMLVIATGLMSKMGAKTAGLFVASIALINFAIGMRTLAEISWEGIAKSFVAFSAGISVLVGAAYLLSPVIGTLLMVSGAAALFGVAAIAFGAGLIFISMGISALGLALAGGATAIVAGLAAIILGILGLVPEIIQIAKLAILGFAESIIELSPIIAKALGTLILEAVKMLSVYIPMIVTAIMDLLINTMRAISDRLPELIVAGVELLESFFRGFIEAFKIMDPKVFLTGIKAIGLLTISFLMMAALAQLFPQAMLGVLAFGVLATELALVIAGVNALFSGKGMSKTLTDGGNILMLIGTAIGKFIGGIIGGIGAGISNSMPSIATNLSQFMNNLDPFLKKTSSIDSNILGKIALLSGAILILSAANFISGITKILSFGQTLPNLGKQLGKFMNNAEPFITASNTITPNMLKGVNALTGSIVSLTAANVLKGITSFLTGGNKSFAKFGKEIASLGSGMRIFVKNIGSFSNSEVTTIDSACRGITALAEASKKIPSQGGLWSWLAGENSIAKFSKYLPELGTNLSKFVTNLGSFSNGQIDTVGAASSAVKILSEAAKEIPNEGGLWGWLSGDNSLGKFSKYLPELGKNLQGFVTSLGTFNETQVTAADCAGKAILSLATAAKQIPNTGGLWSGIVGDNSIATFGNKLPGVAINLKEFVKNLGSFSASQVESADCAGKAILSLAKAGQEIPRDQGIWGWLVGDNSIGKFSDKLPGVATNLALFVKNLGTFSTDQITAVDCAGKSITALAKAGADIPNEGSAWEWLTGKKSLSDFGYKLPGIALNLAMFVRNLGTFNEAQVTAADCAGKAISALGNAASKIPSQDGLWQWLVGDNSIAKFGYKLPMLGINLSMFVKNLGTFSTDQVSAVDCAGKAILAIATAGASIQNSGGMVSWFTGDNDIEDFAKKLPVVGTALSKFIMNIGTFGKDQINTVNAASGAMTALTKFDNIDVKNVNEGMVGISSNLSTFGKSLASFASGVSLVSEDDIKNAITKMNTVIDMSKNIATINIKSLETFGDSLKEIGNKSLKGFIDSFSATEPKDKASRGIRDLIISMLTAAESKRSEMVDKFKSIIDSTLGATQTKEYGEKYKNAGKYFSQGFANGINENRYLVIDAGTALGNAAYESARKSIDAHSPSKKAHKLGNFFGQGFVNAIVEYGSIVYDESYNIGNKANKGLNKGISSINNILDDTLNGSPTIRPILDLSEIKSGATSISGMLNNLDLNPSLNAISVGMSRRGQNGMNDDVVAAINKLGSTLSGPGNTYIIDGVTYGSDGEISQAIETLVRAANIERRT